MQIQEYHKELSGQLELVLQRLSDTQYTASRDILSGAFVGKHFRHIINFYEQLIKGIETKNINYDLRERTPLLETSTEYALEKLSSINASLLQISQDVTVYVISEVFNMNLESSLYREWIYVTEHTIHHLAIIKPVLEKSIPPLPENFGIAPSTLLAT